MDTNQANKTDFAWSALLQFADRHSDEALQLLLAAFEAEAEAFGDRDEAKLHLAETWATAYSLIRSEILSNLEGLSAAERNAVSAAEILQRDGADASKVLSRIAQAKASDTPPEADLVEFPQL
jgi:hypothetical protein